VKAVHGEELSRQQREIPYVRGCSDVHERKAMNNGLALTFDQAWILLQGATRTSTIIAAI
jgi:hypothetical protein